MAFSPALSRLSRLAAGLTAALSLGCAAQAQQVEGIAAVVNDEPITTYDVRDRMRLIISSANIQPSEEALARIQEQAIRGLVDEALQLQQAREFEIEVSEAEVEESLSDIAARNGTTVDQITAELAESGINIETLRSQIRAEIAWQIMVSGRFRNRVRISDAQIETSLDRIAQSASEPQVRMGEILIELPASGEEEQALATIQTIFNQLRQGAPFQQLAAQFSAAPSARQGGDAGWLAYSQMDERIADVARQLQPGQISNPVRVPGGYMVVAVIEKRDGQAVEQLELIQVTLPASQVDDDARRGFERAVRRIDGCEGVEARFEGVEGAFVTDLGAVGANALVPQIRDALRPLEPGQSTAVLDTAAGLQTFVLCDRTITGPGVPSPAEVENRLVNQQLSLMSRRWLRDLRREATVEIR